MTITYPDVPGFRTSGPSEDTARKIITPATFLRGRILNAFVTNYPKGFTADEMADLLDESILNVRPRVSELRRQGHIDDCGDRRPNESGHNATVWRFVPVPFPKAVA